MNFLNRISGGATSVRSVIFCEKRPIRRLQFRIVALTALLLAFAIASPRVSAQTDTPSAPSSSTTETAASSLPSYAPTPAPKPIYGTGVVSPLPLVPGPAIEGAPIQWGPIGVRPHLTYRLLYGDGLQRLPGESLTTAINTIAPGVLFDLGDKWRLDYTPTKTFYSNSHFTDTLDHFAVLNGATTYDALALQFTQNYALSSQPLVETGSQTKQETYSTDLGVTYAMGEQMRLEINASQDVRLAEGFPATREWSTLDWFHFLYAPQLDTAVGIGLGYVDISPGPNMQYIRPQASVTFKPTEKTSFQVQGGVETRKFNSSGTGKLHNAIFSAGLHYHPVEATTLTIQGSRAVTPSYLARQVTVNTGWNASVDQRLLGEFHLSAGYAHQKASYVITTAGLPAGRDDRYDSVNLRLSTTLLRRGTIAALYQISRNSSNTPGYGFSSHQIGLELGYRF